LLLRALSIQTQIAPQSSLGTRKRQILRDATTRPIRARAERGRHGAWAAHGSHAHFVTPEKLSSRGLT